MLWAVNFVLWVCRSDPSSSLASGVRCVWRALSRQLQSPFSPLQEKLLRFFRTSLMLFRRPCLRAMLHLLPTACASRPFHRQPLLPGRAGGSGPCSSRSLQRLHVFFLRPQRVRVGALQKLATIERSIRKLLPVLSALLPFLRGLPDC